MKINKKKKTNKTSTFDLNIVRTKDPKKHFNNFLNRTKYALFEKRNQVSTC